MATRYRSFQSNEIYFLTFTILGWKKIFVSDKYINLVYRWFDYIDTKYGNKIFGYVIMPDHIHLLLKVTDKSQPVPKLIQNAKRFLAYDIVKLLTENQESDILNFFRVNARTEFGAIHKVFEPGYDSLIIQSRKFFLEKLNYIHRNPCREKYRLASCPEEYIHSSASNYFLNKGVYKVEIMEI